MVQVVWEGMEADIDQTPAAHAQDMQRVKDKVLQSGDPQAGLVEFRMVTDGEVELVVNTTSALGDIPSLGLIKTLVKNVNEWFAEGLSQDDLNIKLPQRISIVLPA